PGVRTAADPNRANDVASGALPPAVLALFNAIGAERGNDPDVAAGAKDNQALSFAASNGAVVTVTNAGPLTFGSDGPAAGTGSLVYALAVVDATFSGVSTTGGTQIFLYNGTGAETGLILGRVGTEAGATDTADPAGTVAFALTVDPTNGQVFIAQYLSLFNPTAGSTPAAFDDIIQLNTASLSMVVTKTDGDGDTASASANIGNLITFQDDGPSAPVVSTSGIIAMASDETPGVQTAADPNPANDVASGALPPAVLALFNAIGAERGNDPDVAAGAKDNQALSFAASNGALVTVTNAGPLTFGSDGPAAGTGSLVYALSVVDATFSGVSTTGGTQIFLYNGTGAGTGLGLGRVGTAAG